MNQFLRRCAAIERTLVALFQNYDAASLDALIAGIDRGGNKVRAGNVGDEASALLHLQHRLFARRFHSAMRIRPLNIPVSTPT